MNILVKKPAWLNIARQYHIELVPYMGTVGGGGNLLLLGGLIPLEGDPNSGSQFGVPIRGPNSGSKIRGPNLGS
jgi:hypothetical protein